MDAPDGLQGHARSCRARKNRPCSVPRDSLETLEVHVLDEGDRWREVRTYRGDERVRAAPFEAIELELSALWSGPKKA